MLEKSLSIDAVQKYKPAPEAYRYAADTVGEDLGSMMMVAAHGWDIAGAAAAGMQTAFVARPGKAPYALAPAPTFAGKDLLTIAKKIIQINVNK